MPHINPNLLDKLCGDVLHPLGFDVTREGANITMKPRTQLETTMGTFVPKFVFPEDCTFTLFIDGKSFPCTCKKDERTRRMYYVDNGTPLMVPYVPGSVHRMSLECAWGGPPSRTKTPGNQTILDGTFKMPEALDAFGEPGIMVNMPHMGTFALLAAREIMGGNACHAQTTLFAFFMPLKV